MAANEPSMTIDGRLIALSQPPYVIAEISANHNGRLGDALKLISIAADAGADAIKLQHYRPDTLTVRSELPAFMVSGGTLWDGRQLFDLYAEAMTPWEWTDALAERARSAGISWFSSPFDPTAIDFLEERGAPAYKIASFELVDIPLISRVAACGKPIIMSTGMASVTEIDDAVTAARGAGATEIALLRCNSAYPAQPEQMDLNAIPEMRQRWQLPVGLSDHTLDHTAAIAAVALGACVIEKHVTLERAAGGPDAAFSLEPDELEELVAQVRTAHSALGTARFGPSESEHASLAFRRSLRAIAPIRAGEALTADNVRSIRPAGGLPPVHLDDVLGRSVAVDLEVGAPVTWDVLDDAVGRDDR